ncbi:helix-turn-helix domain-containing protein [Microbacterium trichothecenolyticum]|uniref:helix-turn-helix domain-containing protein n=1 Tax=Microbacterium trichothecenolyticum TaxID=69370 RepID=UPI001C6E3AA5|nr:helix-turn-helix domain-containing protein [Microbacterium trichothecenolyticum]MBW9118863.1 helix-turn-helix domain-containing protein [Microbacterium trichothecenolyticum]
MSLAALSWAFGLKLPPNEKIVLLALADCENDETLRCDPSQRYLAVKASVSERTVRDMLKALEGRDLIRREKRADPMTGGRQTDNYRLAMRGFPADSAGGLTGKSEGGYRQAAAGISLTQEPEEISGPVPEVTHDAPVDKSGTGPKPHPGTVSATYGKPLHHADVFAAIGHWLPSTFDDEQLDTLADEIVACARPARVFDPTGYVIQAVRNTIHQDERRRGRWLLRADEIALEHVELAQRGARF